MPERRRPRFDPDERFSLHPDDPEDVLKKLLGAEDVPIPEDEDGAAEDTDS